MPDATNRPYATVVGRQLRDVRVACGFSLDGVERQSGGRFKNARIGSYERGQRVPTVSAIAAIAEFYGVPVAALLPGSGRPGGAPGPELVFDLAALAAGVWPRLHRWVTRIQCARGDYGGRVLTVRAADDRALAVLMGGEVADVRPVLEGVGVLATGGRRAELQRPGGAVAAP